MFADFPETRGIGMFIRILLLGLLFQASAESSEPEARLEHKLNYTVETPFLEQGNFQYFYGLLKQNKEDKGFTNLYQEQSKTPVEEILKTFLPLDTKNHWDPQDGHFLALARISYLLPVPLEKIDEKRLTDTDYLQKTLPRYEVTKKEGYFHIGGSLITPDFDLRLSFLDPEHPYVDSIPLIDSKKLKAGKIKVAFMHQDNFGKVLIFKTAKASSALIIYEESSPERTLVTQYILSNIINVPAKELIRRGMIDNIQDVVKGSRSAF